MGFIKFGHVAHCVSGKISAAEKYSDLIHLNEIFLGRGGDAQAGESDWFCTVKQMLRGNSKPSLAHLLCFRENGFMSLCNAYN